MSLQALLDLDELSNTIVHLLDGIVLCESHAALVGDVIDATLSFGVLTTGSTHLQIVLAGNFLKAGLVGRELWHLDVDRSADGGAQVGGAEREEAETVVVGEGNAFLNIIHGRYETTVNL